MSDSEESKVGSEEKTGDERGRRDLPSAKTEPSAPPKDSALKPTDAPSSRHSLKAQQSRRKIHRCGPGVFWRYVQSVFSTVESCKESGKSSGKRSSSSSSDAPLAKDEDREKKPGEAAGDGAQAPAAAPPPPPSHTCLFAPAEGAKNEDTLEGHLNGDRESLEEMEESKKEDKNGSKAKFMFNIADGGFTGSTDLCFPLSR